MERTDIKNGLSLFVDELTSQTYMNTYREQKRSSLLADGLGTRANSIWKMANYIVAFCDDDPTNDIDMYLRGWSELCKNYKNQYLIIALNNQGDWNMYDSEGNLMGGNDFIKEYIQKQSSRFFISSYLKNEGSSLKKSIYTFLAALRTKPFMLLAGISGTGKSRIVRKLAQATVTQKLQEEFDKKSYREDFNELRWNLHRPANFELIQVKPNWHNSMDVVGYLSNIPEPHYELTPFIEFIAKAWQHPEVPFFLCLDEMNLAPVEEYFAEFLSAIESRSKEGGEYRTDPIIKAFNSFNQDKDDDTCDKMVNKLFPNFDASQADSPLSKVIAEIKTKGLSLPENLIVIGTVNMDETTFSFSRKVLDRAMSIEMNEVDYSSFLKDTTDEELKAVVEKYREFKINLNELLVNRHIHAKEVVSGLDKASNVIKYLETINNLLEGTPFKLGYRAANEALIYLQSTIDFGIDNFAQAMDNFTLMKILSRIEGDESKLRITDSQADNERLVKAGLNRPDLGENPTILQALRAIIVNQLYETPTTEDGEESKSVELKSIKKIDQMISQLNRDHFVSYWN